jgi:hypothetical protein
MIQGLEENLEELAAAIRADLELVERLPRLQIDVLHNVVRAGPVAQQSGAVR